jgi:hypothetical protein
MKRPPRSSKEHLVTLFLIVHGFFFIGLFLSLFSTGLFIWDVYLNSNGLIGPGDLFFCFANWQDGYKGFTQTQLNELLYLSQSTAFASIVIMQSCND